VRNVRIGGAAIRLLPHNCFACGSLNTHGLHLELHTEGGRCWTDLTLSNAFEGWEGIAHGGVICTILDEVMAWAVVDSDLWGVTARMSVEFKRPVPIGRPLRGEGRVIEARRRVVRTEGILLDAADRTVLARAEAVFVGAKDAQKDELKARYGFRLEDDPPRESATPVSVDAAS
jgi:acyl-coenzyme A thioesterase PaaI-like protein